MDFEASVIKARKDSWRDMSLLRKHKYMTLLETLHERGKIAEFRLLREWLRAVV